MDYKKIYAESIENPKDFWSKQASEFVAWEQPWDKVYDCDFRQGQIRWYCNGKLNVTKTCLDRHAKANANRIALLWEGNDPKNKREFTYSQLLEEVCKTANVLKELGVQRGDRVCIYMPMIPETVMTMLACARIGAVHTVVFGGFSSEALKTRIEDCGCSIVVTANEGLRGTKTIPLKESVDKAIADLPQVKTVLVVQSTDSKVSMVQGRDHDYATLIAKVNATCDYVVMDAEDPLFILYTSGSTGKPKGIVHSSGGYLTYAAFTFNYAFDYKPQDIYWCTADVGWITGHTYLVYGPLAVGATILMYEGVPNYPDASRMWEIVDKYEVSIFYTAPTLIRSLMSHGDSFLNNTSRDSLRILGTVGEPINPAAWEWYSQKVGNSKCPVIDTWWQTETGGILLCPIPNVTKLKPGSATTPMFGITPAILDEQGNELTGEAEGYLAFKTSWPGQTKGLYNNHNRFVDTYFKKFPGYYLCGDSARRDEDGYYWITGRTDDVLNVSGHRIGTAEIESVLVKHPAVAEAAVVGCKDEITGEAIYAYVQLMDGQSDSPDIRTQLLDYVRKDIGSFAVPKHLTCATDLPKTRSGKIMRRILRKIAAGETTELGDISTLGNPEAVEAILLSLKT